MDLIKILCKENGLKIAIIISLTIISSLINIGLLIQINEAISILLEVGSIEYYNIGLLIILLFLFLVINRISLGKTTKLSLYVAHKIRMEIFQNLRLYSYLDIKEKKEEIYSTATKDLSTIASVGLVITQLLTSVLLIIGCYIYLGYLSIQIASVVLVINMAAIFGYLLIKRKNHKYIEKAREEEDNVFYYTREILDGFKELKVNPKKGEEIIQNSLFNVSEKCFKYSCKGYSSIYNLNAIGQGMIYIIIIVLLSANHVNIKLDSNILVSCIMATLFLTSSISSLSVIIPKIIEGNIASIRVKKIISKFSQIEQTNKTISKFKTSLILENVVYTYETKKEVEKGFILGPLNLNIQKGNITFICGGNGAGKSTLFNLIIGLLEKQKGEILIDGASIINYKYHDLFSPIFSDFHLFDKFYGLENIDIEEFNRYLTLFELNKIVHINNDHFSTIDLSTGQRKRLALIIMLLEKRPILMLDEWAADQDPIFRDKFYMEILPILKQENFTIIAITHDDKYYHVADILYKMDYGKLIKY